MSEQRNAALNYINQHESDFLEELKQLVALPSVSSDPEHKADMTRTAEWVANKLRSLGMQKVQVMPTAGHPVVYGESVPVPGKATVLIYGHYDVQPVDPLELWKTPPFEANLRGENLYGRGASDMKGQVVASLHAIEAIVRTGGLPVNVKFMIEGEEEIGSPSLAAWMKEHASLLQADFCLNPDSGMIGAQYPTITYGLRGLAYFEVRVYGPDHDLHSGVFGGAVHNPAIVLAELIAGMHDEQGRITLPGFYDSVRSLTEEERQNFARLPSDEAFYLAQTGAPALFGEAGYTSVERASARPTLDVNGMTSGFTGVGQKTVLPAYAMAKISCRLVPDQDPDAVYQQMKAYLTAHAPKTVRWELEKFHSAPASISDLDLPGVKALAAALHEEWNEPVLYKREGGSIPVVGDMQTVLRMPSVLTGFGLPDDNLHAPNEKIHLPTWYKGTRALVRFFFNL